MTYLSSFRQWQREYCTSLLIRAKGNVCAAAEIAGVHRNTLSRIMQIAGLDVDKVRQQIRRQNYGRLGWRKM